MDKNLQHKGRVAFEINTHEVMITELLINNILTDLHPTEIVAILSCFVFEQVSNEYKTVVPYLVNFRANQFLQITLICK